MKQQKGINQMASSAEALECMSIGRTKGIDNTVGIWARPARALDEFKSGPEGLLWELKEES